MLFRSNFELFEKCKALRQYGWNSNRISIYNGTVSRLDEIQAAILRFKLNRLDFNNQRRNEIAHHYRTGIKLETMIMPPEPTQGKHVYHLFVVRLNNQQKTYFHLSLYLLL